MAPGSFEQEVMRSLGRIEATLDGLAREQKEQNVKQADHEHRLGVIEHARSRQKGVMAVLSAMVSAVVAFIVKAVSS